MTPMTSLLLLTAGLAIAAGGLATALPALATVPETGTPARPVDPGTPRSDRRAPVIPSVQPALRAPIEVKALAEVPEPSTRNSVQQPAGPEPGMPQKAARADRTDAQPDPYLEALLEQSRAQTAALQQIAALQRASEDAHLVALRAQTERSVQLNGARLAINGAVQSLQGMGDWNADSLESTGTSLRQTAAAASAAGSPIEASRAMEAAGLVEAAKAALAQRNSQQAQYYLLEANDLLFGAPSTRE